MLLLTLIALSLAVLADADVSPVHELVGGVQEHSDVGEKNHTAPSHFIPHPKMSPKLIVAKPNAGSHKPGRKSKPNTIVKRLPDDKHINPIPKMILGFNRTIAKPNPKTSSKKGLNHTIAKPEPKASPKVGFNHTISKPKPKVIAKVGFNRTIPEPKPKATHNITEGVKNKPKGSPTVSLHLKTKPKGSPKVSLHLKPKPKVSPKATLGFKPKAKVNAKLTLSAKPWPTASSTIKPRPKANPKTIPDLKHLSKVSPKYTTLKPKVSPKTAPQHSNHTSAFTSKTTKKHKKPRDHWPECTIYQGKRFRKNEWGRLYFALAKELRKEAYSPLRMEVWSACKQVIPGIHQEKWITAFWDTKTPNAHSCSAVFSHDPTTKRLKLKSGPACHVESVDLCVSQMKDITRCRYPPIL